MNNPPYGPDDLKEAPLSGPDFLKLLSEERQRQYPGPPPFYDALSKGTLGREIVQLWVKNQYAYWDSDLVYSTAAIFCKTNEEDTRTHILRKMVCIEGKEIVNDINGWTTPAYEELWLRLGEALGVSRGEVAAWSTFTRTYFATSTLRLLSRYWEWTWLDGLAGMYAGDLFGRDYLGAAREGLERHYGLSGGALAFFDAYVGDVSEDIGWEEEALAYWACTRERQLTAARAFRNRLDIEYQMVLPLHAAASGTTPLQVPAGTKPGV
ncbi:MAG: hypothetical protein IIC94_05125 [Chloroflexi bacterium]|nr:hypothetical protein [Chloroflexota bacterium]